MGPLRSARFPAAPESLTVITAAGVSEAVVLRCAAAIRNELRRIFAGDDAVQVIGPAPYAVVRVNNRFRYRVTLLCRRDRRVRQIVSDILCRYNTDKEFKGVSVFADADPTD